MAVPHISLCEVAPLWGIPLTNVDVLQKLQVHRSPNHIRLSCWEDDFSAIVAFVQSVQDVLGVIRLHVAMSLHLASLMPLWRLRQRLIGLVSIVLDLWPLQVCSARNASQILFVRGLCGERWDCQKRERGYDRFPGHLVQDLQHVSWSTESLGVAILPSLYPSRVLSFVDWGGCVVD